MNKNVIITIMVDDVPMEELGNISEQIEEVFKEYPFKRITMNLGDIPMVKQQAQFGEL